MVRNPQNRRGRVKKEYDGKGITAAARCMTYGSSDETERASGGCRPRQESPAGRHGRFREPGPAVSAEDLRPVPAPDRRAPVGRRPRPGDLHQGLLRPGPVRHPMAALSLAPEDRRQHRAQLPQGPEPGEAARRRLARRAARAFGRQGRRPRGTAGARRIPGPARLGGGIASRRPEKRLRPEVPREHELRGDLPDPRSADRHRHVAAQPRPPEAEGASWRIPSRRGA